ncbi:MAG: lauroyl acyltransferase [Mariprofundaceae bacterium]|nr:lauroyl acyltransferase [Mariprofundaceae bacterium]
MDKLIAIGIRLLFRGIRLLPVRLAGAIGAGIGRAAFFLFSRHRNIALRNLKRIYPDSEKSWRKTVGRESFAELGRTMLELPHVFLRSREFLLSRVEVEGEALFREAMERKQGVFLNACHHSNWELGALMFSLLGYDSSIIYRPIKNMELENYLKACRERFGAVMQSRFDGLRWLPKTLNRGGSVAVMVDQHMSQGIVVPFLGHASNTTALPATFFIRNQTPMFGVAIERLGRNFSFRLKFWPITPPALTGDKALDTSNIMQTITGSFDDIIHARPELWLWIHRRWLILDEQEMAGGADDGTS